ncbi:hypothetical protein SALBM217S_07579 [Streptomyces griseoloalbus]
MNLTHIPAQVLVDDHPRRDRFHAEVAEPLELSALAAFAEQLRTAHRTLSEQDPGWADGPNALRADTVTPLAPGTGVRLDTDGTGALGVALDATSADIADALPRLGRLARLANLRRATDLHVPGTRAGSLLTDAVGTGTGRQGAGGVRPRGTGRSCGPGPDRDRCRPGRGTASGGGPAPWLTGQRCKPCSNGRASPEAVW